MDLEFTAVYKGVLYDWQCTGHVSSEPDSRLCVTGATIPKRTLQHMTVKSSQAKDHLLLQ